MAKKKIVNLISALIIVGCTFPASGSELWWQFENSGWCLKTDSRSACISSSLRLERVASKRLSFFDNEDPHDILFLKYEINEPSSVVESLMNDPSFQLDSVATVSSLSLSHFSPAENLQKDHSLFATVISIDDKHCIVIHGLRPEKVMALANEFAAQWE